MIAGIASAVGGFFNMGSQALQNHLNRKHELKMSDLAYQRSKEFAQNGINWRANDARNAGLHPLAALGVNPGSGPAMAVTNNNPAPRYDGPDFLTIQNQKLQNDLLKAQIANINGQTLKDAKETAQPRMASLTDMPGQASSLTQSNRGSLQHNVISGYDLAPGNLYSFQKDSEGNILRGPSKDLPDAYTEGPLSFGLALEMFRPFSDKELGRVADRLMKNGELNPNTHDLVQGISPVGRYIRIHPKDKPLYSEEFKSGLKNIYKKFKNGYNRIFNPKKGG